jgi:tRNA(Ile)-lysidine synthase
MPTVLDCVRRTLTRHDLVSRETRVVVALSGGSDSVALAYLVRELEQTAELRVAGLAHFNHQLRPAADADQRLCETMARSVGWLIVVDREDVAVRARRERRSLEDAARTARYAFLERARMTLSGDVVALGHTRDDQAETFLLRLLRGAGARGLAAMHPRAGVMIRPLLDCRRRDLRAYLDARQIAYVEDESNHDVGIPRNRVRAELLPLLERRFNPAVVDVLARQATLARDDWRWMEAAAEALSSDVCRHEGDLWTLDVAGLTGAPLGLRRYVLWCAMTKAARGRPVSFDHVEAALGLLGPDDGGASLDAPGQRVERVGPDVVLRSRPRGTVGRAAPQRPNLFRFPLSIPGEALLAEAGFAVSAELSLPDSMMGLDVPGFSRDPAVALVRRDVCGKGLAVRNRRPGDHFRPVGLGGRKTLQDFFVDRKVVRADRDTVPLVVDEADRIVWVAGYGIDEEFRVTESTQPVLILRLRVLGGAA